MYIKEIKSKITLKTIHYIIKFSEDGLATNERKNVISSENFLQLSIMKFPHGKTFKPHKHIYKNLNSEIIAQESWIVLKGSARVIFYDIDGTFLQEEILNTLDSSITLEGGHNYEIMVHDSIIYEYKSGPYLGQALDKEFIDD